LIDSEDPESLQLERIVYNKYEYDKQCLPLLRDPSPLEPQQIKHWDTPKAYLFIECEENEDLNWEWDGVIPP
jgi:hypothetical protein